MDKETGAAHNVHGEQTTESVEIESIWGPRLGKLTVGLLLTIVAGAFEALAVATVMPETVDDLGGLHYYGWILASFTLANMVGIVLAGTEIDRIGMVRPFMVGIVLFSVGLLIGGLAPSMPVLILGRVAQGFASGMLLSVAWTAVGKAYPPDARPRLMALTSSAWVIPGLVGPAVAGFVAEHIGWRWVFLGMIPFPLIAMALTVPSLRAVDVVAGGARDLSRFRDALLLAAGTALLLGAFGRTEWWALLGLGAVGLLVLIPSFGRLTPPGTLRARRGVATAVASVILLTVAFFGFEFFIPLALTDLRHQSPVMSGLPLTASALTWTAGAWVVDRTSTRYARSLLVRIGLATIGIGILLTLAVCVTDMPVLLVLPAWAVTGLGMGLAFSTLMLVVLDAAPEGSEGATISAGQLGNTLGVALGVGIGGSIVAVTSIDDVATARGFVLVALGSVIVLGLAIAIAGRLTDARAVSVAESGV
ncbi:MAG: MFS transporter [Thermomicrobiales bacterium]|nr:MFS transporter [Thermomicrobiales bacterium]